MLQQRLIQRIARIYRLRLLYGLHLTIYGIVMVFAVLTVDPTHWHTAALLMMLWLPILVGHTTAQSLYELRERCASYELIPVQSFSRYTLPVDLYDEQGNPVSGRESDDAIPLLPPYQARPRQDEF